jgi:Lipocalin-like domain/Reductive dehalogenase subunit
MQKDLLPTDGTLHEDFLLCPTIYQILKMDIKMNTVNRRSTFASIAVALSCLAVVLPDSDAAAQSVKEQLVGTWLLVSNYNERPDGTRFELLGANPIGMLILDRDGYMSSQQMRSGLPKFASNNRWEGTSEENKAIVQGVLCYFGTYSVSESDHTLNFHIESSSFPNWNGSDQKRIFTVAEDELTYTSPGSSGGIAHVVWKRAK